MEDVREVFNRRRGKESARGEKKIYKVERVTENQELVRKEAESFTQCCEEDKQEYIEIEKIVDYR